MNRSAFNSAPQRPNKPRVSSSPHRTDMADNQVLAHARSAIARRDPDALARLLVIQRLPLEDMNALLAEAVNRDDADCIEILRQAGGDINASHCIEIPIRSAPEIGRTEHEMRPSRTTAASDDQEKMRPDAVSTENHIILAKGGDSLPLVVQGSVPSLSDETVEALLTEAAKANALDGFRYILSNFSVNLDRFGKRGDPLLHQVLDCDSSLIIEVLEAGASLDLQNKVGDTALHLACRSRNQTAVALLCERGARLEIRNLKGQSAFSLAWRAEDWRSSLILATYGANYQMALRALKKNDDGRRLRAFVAEARDAPGGIEFLSFQYEHMSNCLDGAPGCCRILEQWRADFARDVAKHIDGWNGQGFTALYEGVATQDIARVKRLLRQGADPWAKNACGDATPIEHAYLRAEEEGGGASAAARKAHCIATLIEEFVRGTSIFISPKDFVLRNASRDVERNEEKDIVPASPQPLGTIGVDVSDNARPEPQPASGDLAVIDATEPDRLARREPKEPEPFLQF